MTSVETSTTTPWMRERAEWIQGVTGDQLAALARVIEGLAHLDENDGDRTETRESLEWLWSRGRDGEEWGLLALAARRLGLWPVAQ